MFLAATLFLALAEPQPATAEQEAHIKSTLAPAVEVMGQKDSCSHPEIKPSDFLAIIGAYEGETIPTVTVAGQDDDTSLADVVISKGHNPIYLVLSSYDPLIWRISGDTKRIRQMLVFHRNGAGVIGVPAKKIRFSKEDRCQISYTVYEGRQLETDVPALAAFGRRANATGGDYALYRARLDASSLTVDKVDNDPDWHGSDRLENEFHRMHPAGIASIDPRDVVASEAAVPYEVLPKAAGAYQLGKSGAIVPATEAEVRRWKDRAIIGGHVRADRIRNFSFHSAYRVTRPIRIPAGLCGAYSMTFLIPSPDFVKGDPCHSSIYVEDGTVWSGH